MARSEIRQALINDLSKIQKANGFISSLTEVSERYLELEDIKEPMFPCAALNDLGSRITKLNDGESEVTWNIAIVLYAKDNNGKLNQRFDDLFEDVQELLDSEDLELINLGMIESLEVTSIVPDPFNENSKGMAYIPIKIVYYK